ncbi:hypothetical protein L1049_025030 [Liquidambar formosana]|uniref:Uncharacterized protein n=1 Tax=Liquidambar formosana TaxID=63359 RepID=A0AAP0S2E9_LIQFO
MSKSKGVLLPFVFFLVSTSLLSPNSVVYGSSVQEQSFNRPDPLRHFKSYSGGYDVRSKHYWASAAFTGVHGYAIAGVWTLCGLGFGIFMIVKNLSSSSTSIADHSNSRYFILFLLILLFTFLAIVATSFALAANQSTLRRTKKLKETILRAGGDARRTIRKVTKAFKEMQHHLLPYDPDTSFRLNITTHRLGKESRIIQRFVQKNGHSINLAIQTSYIAHLGVVTVNLVLLVAALVLLLLHWHPAFITIIFICWILTTLCWVLTGFDFFLHTFAEDTCSAFEDFQQNPLNSSLSSLLPCMDSSYSNKVIVEIGSTIHNFITELNLKVTELHRLLELDEEAEELLGDWRICDPFSGAPNYSYIPEKCPKGAIPIGEIPNVLARFTCYKENSTRECKGNGKFLTEASFVMAWAYTCSIQDLINIFPDLQNLAQCSFVKDAFFDVASHQCRPFRVSVRLLWSSMLCLSIFMVIIVLIWVAKAYQDKGRYFSKCSIIPNPL